MQKKSKPKPKPTLIFKNCSYVHAYGCAQLSYTTQHRTILQTCLQWFDAVGWAPGRATGL